MPASLVLVPILRDCMQILLSNVHQIVRASKESNMNTVNSDVMRACCVVDAAIANFAVFEVLEHESEKSTFAMAFVARCAIYVFLEDTDDEGAFETSDLEHSVTAADISSWSHIREQYEHHVHNQILKLMTDCLKDNPNDYHPAWSVLLSGFHNCLGLEDGNWFSKILEIASQANAAYFKSTNVFSRSACLAIINMMEYEGVFEVITCGNDFTSSARHLALVCEGLASVFALDSSEDERFGSQLREFYRDTFAPAIKSAATTKFEEKREAILGVFGSTITLCIGGNMSKYALLVLLNSVFGTVNNEAHLSKSSDVEEVKAVTNASCDDQKVTQDEDGSVETKAASEDDPANENPIKIQDEAPQTTYRRGESVVYMRDPTKRKGEAAVVMKVHVDDEGLPYYTIRLSTGIEKQTEGPRLRPLIAAYQAQTTMRKDGTYDGSNSAKQKVAPQKRKHRRRRSKQKVKFDLQARADGWKSEVAVFVWIAALTEVTSILQKAQSANLLDVLANSASALRTISKFLTGLSLSSSSFSIEKMFIEGSSEQVKLDELRSIVYTLASTSDAYLELFAALHPESWSKPFDIGNTTEKDDCKLSQTQYAEIVKKYIFNYVGNDTNTQKGGLLYLCESAVYTITDFISEIEVSSFISDFPRRIFEEYMEMGLHEISDIASLVACSSLLHACAANDGHYYVEVLSHIIIRCLVKLCQTVASCEIDSNISLARDAIDAFVKLLPWVKPDSDEDMSHLFELLLFKDHIFQQMAVQNIFAKYSKLRLHGSYQFSSEDNVSPQHKVEEIEDPLLLLPATLRKSVEAIFALRNSASGKPSHILNSSSSDSCQISLWRAICEAIKCSSSRSSRHLITWLSKSGLMTSILRKCFETIGVIGPGNLGSRRKQSLIDALIPRIVKMPANSVLYGSLRMTASCAQILSIAAIFDTATTFPAMIREWWMGLTRSENNAVGIYFEKYISAHVVQDEFSRFNKVNSRLPGKKENSPVDDPFGDMTSDDEEKNAGGIKMDGMQVRIDAVARAVVATYIKDDCRLEIGIELPTLFPLKQVKVTCRKRFGIREDRWRRWSLQIVTMLSKRDCSLLDGVLFWKQNVDREFEGVEPCPICYSVVHVTTHALPKIACETCHNQFHSACLYTWFKNSSKSTCPLCRSPF